MRSRTCLASVVAVVLPTICSACGPELLDGFATPSVSHPVEQTPYDVITQHNDNQRLGWVATESLLTTGNVSTKTFGKLFSLPIDGGVTAQPLYLSGLTMSDGLSHNVLYVATVHNHLYAFDADNPNGKPLWLVTMGEYVPASFYGFDVGIMGTPVINRANNAIYFVTLNAQNDDFLFSLHALDLVTGKDRFGSPISIFASAPGTAPDAKSGTVSLQASAQLQRPGILDVNGNIYIALGSNGNTASYHGWVLSYSNTTLSANGAFLTSPASYGEGISNAGHGLVADANGDLLVATDEGGERLIKLHQDGANLVQTDYFQPDNATTLDANQQELGISGVTLVPGTDTQQALVCGGDGNLYNISDQSLGQVSPNNSNATQVFPFATSANTNFGNLVYWSGPDGAAIYSWPVGMGLQAFSMNGSTINTTPAFTSQMKIPSDVSSSGILSLSSNGNQVGSGVIWAVIDGGASGAELYAFNAQNLSSSLWNSTLVTSDAVGPFAKQAVPTVANGKVYVPTAGNAISVYGLK